MLNRKIYSGFILLIAFCILPAVKAQTYIGVSLQSEIVDVDYDKGVLVTATPSYMESGDSDDDAVYALGVLLGHRFALEGDFYWAAELDAAIYSSDEVTGSISGTGTNNSDVFPGRWSLEKNHSIGLTFKLGHTLAALSNVFNRDASIYALAGIRWLDVDTTDYFNNGLGVQGTSRDSEDAYPWSVGFGLESALQRGRLAVELRYSEYDADWSMSGVPHIEHDFDVDEFAVQLIYTHTLGGLAN